MSSDEPSWFRDDLEPEVDEAERTLLWRIADALIAARPYPRAAFRGALNRRLATLNASGHPLIRPRALWARVGALAVCGAALLCLVAAGVAHGGPFAP